MTIKVLSKELSDELGIDKDLIEKIVRSEFKLLKDTISDGEWESVKLQYLGKFVVKPTRRKYAEEYVNYKQQGVHPKGDSTIPPSVDGEGLLVEDSLR